MNARAKFLVGGALVLGTSGFLMVSASMDTGTVTLTPKQLHAKTRENPSFGTGRSVRVAGKIVPGTIRRDPGGREFDFRAEFEGDTIQVHYTGVAPDTFTDGVDAYVEGVLRADRVFEAKVLITKCASRYESVPGGPPTYPKTGAPGARKS